MQFVGMKFLRVSCSNERTDKTMYPVFFLVLLQYVLAKEECIYMMNAECSALLQVLLVD